ncbi:sensor histidine kinase [Lacrimispora celerecrescens]|uniref:histidine kinase n=1 Tax=[Clostridium] celerecrescens 18A TaxID=1286362 RepID=A0A2M8Z669_9FIRM|nr:sensor histidine kinase [Lacrimispora celerecrescens]PJJ28942.1 signal transduction histidine kinase [[Clostridium] celerecrescens 18A]
MSLLNKKNLKQIQTIAHELERILDEDTDEKVMAFTEDKEIKHLLEQINRTLEDRQNANAGYRRSELNTKRMLSNISHDLKTPLTVIIGYLEMLLMQETLEKDMVKKVSYKANELKEQIDQFFTLAKLEAGDTVLTMSKINLNEFCRETIIDFYNILTEKEFEVNINIPDPPVFVYADREALGRILNNLISNAVRYGDAGHYLGLTLRMEDNFVCVDVIDHGKGIAYSEIPRVFDRLYTLEDSRNREIQGNGLGLTIAKSLAEKISGTLTLKSIQNEETVFTLKLQQFNY